MKKFNKIHKLLVVAAIGALFVQFMSATVFVDDAKAGFLSDSYLRLDRMRSSTGSATDTTWRVVFKTPAADNGTEAKFSVQFYHADNPDPSQANNNFTINATQATATAACATETGATALPGTLSASGDNADIGATRKTVTVTGVTDLAAATNYCIDFTTSNSITNPVSAGQYIIRLRTLTSADAVIDDKLVGVRIVDGSTNWDQITVTAVVPPSFNFILSGNTDAFTTLLDIGNTVSTTGRTVTIYTNAAKGWITWVKNSTNGLYSAQANNDIDDAGTVDGAPTDLSLSPSVEQYGLDVDLTTDAADGGTPAIAAEYNGASATEAGTLSTTFQPVASSGGTANGDVITLIERALINASTPAGDDYTDTLTVVGAGYF